MADMKLVATETAVMLRGSDGKGKSFVQPIDKPFTVTEEYGKALLALKIGIKRPKKAAPKPEAKPKTETPKTPKE